MQLHRLYVEMMRCFAIVLLASGCQSLFGLDDSKPRGDGGDGPCYGTDIQVCLEATPTDPVSLTQAIYTGNQAGEGASATCVPYTGRDAGLYCVIAGSSVSVDAVVSVTGSRPVVIVADQTIQIGGTLDAAAHQGHSSGPGADLAMCPAGTIPGREGGGTGGSMGEGGGVGGTGGAGNTDLGGGMCPTPDVTAFRAGCTGQNGGNSDAATGLGGGGGGAAYLIAGTSITVAGTVDVSGGGGTGGRCATCDDTGYAFGGGGGGSGGMLVLESPEVDVTGHVFADGGGGGEGASQSTNGQPGADPGGLSPALGGNNDKLDFHGGGGGSGGHIGVAPTIGDNATSAGAGGGGGGGVGVIRVIGTLTGTTSPAPL
jgi:hypothetical protein